MSEVIEETKEQKLARWQKERVERAAGADYSFEYHRAIGKWIVRKKDDTNPYLLTEKACECGDDTYRARPQGLACKHRCALVLHLLLNPEEARR